MIQMVQRIPVKPTLSVMIVLFTYFLNGAAAATTSTAVRTSSALSTQALNIRYTTVPLGLSPRHVSLDVYSPANATSAPVVLFIHGGGWKRGDKAMVNEKPRFFNDRGWVFVSANYRLIPEGRHPKNAEDVAAAAAWIHNNIASHGGDPGSIFLMGHSAGCHLVALVGTDERHLAKAGKPLSILRGVVALDSQAYDVREMLDQNDFRIYREAFGDDPATLADAAPITHIAPGKGIPPFLIIYSSGMGVLRRNPQRSAFAEDFAKALRDADVPAEVIDGSYRNHMEINRGFGIPVDDKVTTKTWQFLQRQK